MAHDTGFVFNLFLGRRLHPFYENPVSNKVTERNFSPLFQNGFEESSTSYLMVTDIPDYLLVNSSPDASSFKKETIKQYKGFICNLSGYENALGYLKDNLNKKAVRNIKAKKRQLETRHNISYKFYHGVIDKSHYDFLLERFYELLKARFDEKKVFNRYLLDWNRYYEMIYPMILRKEACLFVVYNEDEPIAMAFDCFLEDISFGYIQVFDSNYGKYYMGDVCMLERLDWLLKNEYKVFDFLMGETYYKVKWSNLEYFYYHQIFYNPNSVPALLKLYLTMGKLKLKQYLRDKGVLGKLFSMDRFLYKRMAKKLVDFDWKNP